MPPAPITTWQQIVAGDDAKAADGRALTWTSALWPNLASATLTLTIGHANLNMYGNLPLTVAGSVPNTPANPTTVSLDMTAAQTSQLAAGTYDYTLSAKLADSDVVTIALGKLTVQAAPGQIALAP